MATATVPSARATAWPFLSIDGLSVSSAKVSAALLVAVTVLALGVRTVALSTYGLSEDEINKVGAVEQYRHGVFGANAEHPMLMKLAMWGSLEVAGAWNRIAPPGEAIGVETAIRLPNAVAGAATTVALYGLSELLFGPAVAVAASLLWALDVNAIAINRIGKEDTFLLFFFVLAMWCYERAKRQGAIDPVGAQRWYAGSGASFGLMLASKYMPHYLGIYAVFNTVTDREPGANRPKKLRYYGAMLVAFLAANWAVLMPATWQYCAHYVQGSTLVHHGYLFAGHLYVTNVPISPLGVPPTFYLRLLLTKVPVVVLGAAVAGLIEIVRRRTERGFVLLRVWLTFFIVPYSLMAAKFIRYALPLFAVLDVVAAVGLVSGIGWLLRKSWLSPLTRRSVAVAVLVVSVAGPLLAQASAAPYYSLFRNAIGERFAAGEVFPEETYDYGVREAVDAIAEKAAAPAAIVSDAPAVVAHYLNAIGRADIESRSLSAQGIASDGRQAWVIVQDEHTTFENRDVLVQLRERTRPWQEFFAGEALAAQVFRISTARR
jgi:hypothetical protein